MRSLAISPSILILVFFVTCASGKMPEGFKLDVRPQCGSNGIEDAIITIITDMNLINATANCRNGLVHIGTADYVHFNLRASYIAGGDIECLFRQRNGGVYFVNIYIAYGLMDREIQFNRLSYTVTCTFNHKSNNVSSSVDVNDGLLAARELQTLVGSDSGASLTLKLVDVVGTDITGTNITLGRKIQIKLEATDLPDGIGIYPVSCNITDGIDKYALLLAGCGDGVIFPKDKGFITKGKVAHSPYFKAFGIGSAASLAVECTVAKCLSVCDGESCRNQRKRRSIESESGDFQYLVAATSVKTLIDQPPLSPTREESIDTVQPKALGPKSEESPQGLSRVIITQKSSDDSTQEGSSRERPYNVYGSVIHHQKDGQRKILKPLSEKFTSHTNTSNNTLLKDKEDATDLRDPENTGKDHESAKVNITTIGTIKGSKVVTGRTGQTKVLFGDSTPNKENATETKTTLQTVGKTNTEPAEVIKEDISGINYSKESTKTRNPTYSVNTTPAVVNKSNDNYSNNPRQQFFLSVQSSKLGLISNEKPEVNKSKSTPKPQNNKSDSIVSLGSVRSPVIYIIPKNRGTTSNKPDLNGKLSDILLNEQETKTVPIAGDSGHVLSKPIALYVIGIVIVALFSIANIALGLTLCRRRLE